MQDVQNQVDFFNEVESEKTTPEQILHEIEAFIIKGNRSLLMALNLVEPDLRGKKILEIGCGTAIETVLLLRMAGYDAYGIDLSKNRIELGQAVAKKLNINPDFLSIQKIQDISKQCCWRHPGWLTDWNCNQENSMP